MSTTQAFTRYNLHPPSQQETWTNTLEMGKKAAKKLARQLAQQAQQAQQHILTDHRDVEGPSPFVGQALLDALEEESSPHVGQALLDTLEQQTAEQSAPSSGYASEVLRGTSPASVKKAAPQKIAAQPGPEASLPARPAQWQSAGPAHNNSFAADPTLPAKPASSRYNLRSRQAHSVAGQSHGQGSALYGNYQYQNYSPSLGHYGMGYPSNSQLPQQPQLALNPQAPNFQPYYGQAPGGGVWLHPQGYSPLQPQTFYHPASYTAYEPLRFSRAHSTLASPLTTPSPDQPLTAKKKDKYAVAAAYRAAKRAAAQAVAVQGGLSVPISYSPRVPTPERSPTPTPAPVPVSGYLSQAFLEPSTLSSPQPMLFVLDLNGTLLHRPNRKQPTRFVRRPFVAPFLEYLFANFTVMVWSSARPENVSIMCSQLFSDEQRARVVAQWGRDRLGLTPKQYNNKVQVYKRLTQIWDDKLIARSHPEYVKGRRWDQYNTILLDDSLLKASSEPHNAITIPEFVGTKEQLEGDVLRQVVGYLEQARMQENVSAFMRKTPFKVDGGWDRAWPQ